MAELEPKFGFGEAFRIYGIPRIYGITDFAKIAENRSFVLHF